MNHWRGVAAALTAAGFWGLLADRNPTSTYHFAPMIVAAAAVVIEGMAEAGLTLRATVRLGGLGFGVAALVTLLLERAANLEGPVFWAHGDNAPVVAEHLLFAALGVGLGVGFALRRASRAPS